MDPAGVDRALGAIGTTFRLTRLYPPSHPAVVESMRQITDTLPTLAALGTVEWKVGATGFHWRGQQILPRNTQAAELAGLLYARGIRTILLHPGTTAEHAMALFGVATGSIPVNDAALGQITLAMSRRSQRVTAPSAATAVPAAEAPPVIPAAPVAPSAAVPPQGRASAAFRFEALPVDVQVQRAIADVGVATTPETQRAAVENLQRMTPALLRMRDIAKIAEAITALDRLLTVAVDPMLLAAIGSLAEALADKPAIERMVTRLGEPRVPAAEREALVVALGALASLSVDPVLHAYLAAPLDRREPYRAVIRRAAERALEPLQVRLVDKEAPVVAAVAELLGLTGSPQAVPLLVPLLRHPSEFVREGAATGLGEIGGREISRPLMPALKDDSVVVRSAATRAIAAAGDAAATTVLIRRLEQEQDDGVLADLLRAVGRLCEGGAGTRDALEVLARYAEPGSMLRRRSATIRTAAIEAMATLPGREARGLLELYSHDKEPAVRKAAEAGLR